MMVWTIPTSLMEIGLFIYFLIIISYIIKYFRQKDQETSFMQAVGPVEITLFLIVVGIIFWSLRESGKTKKLKKANELLDQKGNFNKALETYIGIKDWEKAAETIVKSPPGTQIVLLRRLQSFLPQSKIKSIFMKLGEYYSSQNQSNLAASAFQLADMPWRAAQAFIVNKNVDSAIDVINTTPIFSQDRIKATRNLAKFAFDNNYPVEAAQLLQSIGAEDEAVAVLIAAGRNSDLLKNSTASAVRPTTASNQRASPTTTSSQRASPTHQPVSSQRSPATQSTTTLRESAAAGQNNDSRSESQKDSISTRQDVSGTSSFSVIRKELSRCHEKLKDGKISEAEDILSKFSNLISKLPSDESEETIKLKNDVNKTSESIKRLTEARNAFKARKIEQAQIIYSELLESAGDLFSAEIFAEAGLSYEYEPADKELASEFFVEASRKAKTDQAALKYKERADLLIESLHEDLPSAPSGEKAVVGRKLSVDPNEKCCVCRRPIGTSGEVVQCNSCKSVAHYPHMAEWLKIKGVCPVCKQKLSMPETTKVALES